MECFKDAHLGPHSALSEVHPLLLNPFRRKGYYHPKPLSGTRPGQFQKVFLGSRLELEKSPHPCGERIRNKFGEQKVRRRKGQIAEDRKSEKLFLPKGHPILNRFV